MNRRSSCAHVEGLLDSSLHMQFLGGNISKYYCTCTMCKYFRTAKNWTVIEIQCGKSVGGDTMPLSAKILVS